MLTNRIENVEALLKMDFPHVFEELEEVEEYRYGRYILRSKKGIKYLYDQNMRSIRRLISPDQNPWDYSRCLFELGLNYNHLLAWNEKTALDISKETGISEQTLSKYANAATVPNYRNLILLCKAFKCRVEDFTDIRWLGSEMETDYVCNQNIDIFRKRLRKIMDEKKINQIDLSRLTNFTQGTISNYLTGKTYPNLYNLIILSSVIGCPIKEFIV